MTLWYGYVVCHCMPKFNTIPILVVPVLDALQVNPYLCSTLVTNYQIGTHFEHNLCT